MKLTQDQTDDLISAAVAKTIKATEKIIRSSICLELEQDVWRRVDRHIDKWIEKNIFPELEKVLESQKEQMVAAGAEVAKRTTNALAAHMAKVVVRESEEIVIRGKCDTCGYPDTPLEEYGEFDQARGRKKLLCDVCATTHVGQIISNPEALRNPLLFYRSLALVGNMVLDAFHELKHGRKR